MQLVKHSDREGPICILTAFDLLDESSSRFGWVAQLCLLLTSNQYGLNLIERHLVVPAIVELRGARAGVIGHGRDLLECAAVLEIRRDASGAEAVVGSQSLDADRRSMPANHGPRVGLVQGSAGA